MQIPIDQKKQFNVAVLDRVAQTLSDDPRALIQHQFELADALGELYPDLQKSAKFVRVHGELKRWSSAHRFNQPEFGSVVDAMHDLVAGLEDTIAGLYNLTGAVKLELTSLSTDRYKHDEEMWSRLAKVTGDLAEAIR